MYFTRFMVLLASAGCLAQGSNLRNRNLDSRDCVFHDKQWFEPNDCQGVPHETLAEIAQDTYIDGSSPFVKTNQAWSRQQIFSKQDLRVFVYESSDTKCTVLSFRGTDFSNPNAVFKDTSFFGKEDMNTHPCSGSSGNKIKVYPGPYQYLKLFETSHNIPGNTYDYVIGHSLGGSTAILYSQKFGPPLKSTVTFASMATRYGKAKNTLVHSVRYANEDDPAVGNGQGMCMILEPGAALCAANGGGAWEHFNHDVAQLRAFCKHNGNWKDTAKSSNCRNHKPHTSNKLNDKSWEWSKHDTSKYIAAVHKLWPDEI